MRINDIIKNLKLAAWLIIGIMIVSSCAEQDDLLSIDHKKQEQNLIEKLPSSDFCVSREMVDKYLRITKKQELVNRVEPKVENGDTLAYYVEFHHGWALISGDQRLPQVLSQSEVGTVDWSDMNNPGIGAVRGMLNLVRETRLSDKTQKDPVWEILAPKPETAKERNLRKVPAPSNLVRGEGEGMWIPIDTLELSEVYTAPRIISTQWSQVNGYNAYTPYAYNLQGSLEHTPTGCIATAFGQVINYMRGDNSGNHLIPSAVTMPEEAYGVLTVNSFTSDWSILNTTNGAAMFLSYIGKRMNFIYELLGSAPENFIQEPVSLLNYYGISVQKQNNYDYNTVRGNVSNGMPVLIYARETDNPQTFGHAFIIDGYKEETSKMVIRYVWDPFYQLTEWDVSFGEGWRFISPATGTGKEVEGDYSTYAQMDFVISPIRTVRSFAMNWGWGGVSDNIYHVAYYDNGTTQTTYNPYWTSLYGTYRCVYQMYYNFFLQQS